MSPSTLSANSHFDRIGGLAAVEVAVEQFYQRLTQDSKVSHFFTNLQLDQLHQHQVLFLTQLLGGPAQYSGRSLSRAHAQLRISAADYNIVADHLIAVLQSLSVAPDIITDVSTALASVADDIISPESKNQVV
jgi:hemoglobin